MTKILAFSGKKQSGKNTATNFILGTYMLYLKIVRTNMRIDNKGQLWISDIFGDEKFTGIFDINRRDNTHMVEFLEDIIHPHIKVYAFADLLKTACNKILGLTYEQCYGTDKDKNSLTDLDWSNMPGITETLKSPYPDGLMTAREVLQYVGTQIFRTIDNDIWVKALIRKIEEEDTELAIISDCRFPNEVAGIQKLGGKVIRLTRNPFKGKDKDEHKSEIILDKDKFDWKNFDAIIDNDKMSIKEQNETTYKILEPWGYIPKIS